MFAEKTQNPSYRYETNTHGHAPFAATDDQGAPSSGWYYFGPPPPWSQSAPPNATAAWPYGPYQAGHAAAGGTGWGNASAGATAAPHGQGRVANADFKEAFDRLSRGDVSADTIGKLLGLDDSDFWKGALVGAAAALLASNLPILMNMLSGLAQSKPAADAETNRNSTPNSGADTSR